MFAISFKYINSRRDSIIMLKRIDDFSTRIQDVIAASLMILLTIIVFLQVLNRMVLPFAMPWTEELSKLILFWLTYICLASTFKQDYHIRIDFIDGMIKSDIGKRIMDLIVSIMGILFSAILLYYSYEFLLQAFSSGQKTAVLMIPMWIVIIPVFIGSILTLLNFTMQLFKIHSKNKTWKIVK